MIKRKIVFRKMGKIISFDVIQTDKLEACVLCGKITNVSRCTPIDLRSGYVSGVGQLCYSCWRNLYE